MTIAVIGIRVDAQGTSGGKVDAFSKAAAGIFRGKVKQLNKKEIVIENDAKEMVLIRRSHQTTFLRNNHPINSSDIDLETAVTIDAREAADVSLVAIKVSVDSPPTTTDLK
jgi:hypothetical protein